MSGGWERALRIGLPVLALALFFGLWSFYVRNATISAFILPPPEKIGRAFVALLGDPAVWRHVRITLAETLGGFFSALVAGVTLGALMAKLPPLEWALKPFVVALQLIPKIALAPLFILWFGFGSCCWSCPRRCRSSSRARRWPSSWPSSAPSWASSSAATPASAISR
ncbi:MAG TPA: hypothetical protein VIL72_02465 [Beijerinckiaceae bacterium]|jgi:NitT/TauT family transport system permease protein